MRYINLLLLVVFFLQCLGEVFDIFTEDEADLLHASFWIVFLLYFIAYVALNPKKCVQLLRVNWRLLKRHAKNSPMSFMIQSLFVLLVLSVCFVGGCGLAPR